MSYKDDISNISKHPSFGQIGINRVTSSEGINFYGSNLKHSSFIHLTISESQLIRSLNEDRYHAGNQLIQVRMTENQFATMITYGGTPCTISRITENGKYIGVEDPPFKDEQKIIKNEFKEKVDETLTDLRTTLDKVKNLTAPNAKISKSSLLDIQKGIEKALQEISLNMPFVVDTFQRTIDNVITSAKQDIESHIANAVRRVGLEAGSVKTQLTMLEKEIL